MFYNFQYLLVVALPIMALSFLASNWVKRTYARYSQVRNASGLNGVDIARRILTGAGLNEVTIQVIDGDLGDNYFRMLPLWLGSKWREDCSGARRTPCASRSLTLACPVRLFQ